MEDIESTTDPAGYPMKSDHRVALYRLDVPLVGLCLAHETAPGELTARNATRMTPAMARFVGENLIRMANEIELGEPPRTA
jgi:hypothetical protein